MSGKRRWPYGHGQRPRAMNCLITNETLRYSRDRDRHSTVRRKQSSQLFIYFLSLGYLETNPLFPARAIGTLPGVSLT